MEIGFVREISGEANAPSVHSHGSLPSHQLIESRRCDQQRHPETGRADGTSRSRLAVTAPFLAHQDAGVWGRCPYERPPRLRGLKPGSRSARRRRGQLAPSLKPIIYLPRSIITPRRRTEVDRGEATGGTSLDWSPASQSERFMRTLAVHTRNPNVRFTGNYTANYAGNCTSKSANTRKSIRG